MDKERAKALEAAAVDSAKHGIYALLLLNGSACIAVLAFLANAIGYRDLHWSEVQLVRGAMRSLPWFAGGAGLAVFCSFFAYYANQQYANEFYKSGSWPWGKILNIAGGVVAFLALIGFGVGVFQIWTAMPT